jgi:hypothetical protein
LAHGAFAFSSAPDSPMHFSVRTFGLGAPGRGHTTPGEPNMAMKTVAFRPEKFNWYRYAIVGGPFPEILSRPIGFLRAGDELVNIALKHGTVERLFYPTCFCYAHFAESVVRHLVGQMRDFVAVLRALGQKVRIDNSVLDAERGEPGLKELSMRLNAALRATTGEQFEETILSTLTALESVELMPRKGRYNRERDGAAIQHDYELESIREQMRAASAFLLGMVNWLDAQIEEGRSRLESQRNSGHASKPKTAH